MNLQLYDKPLPWVAHVTHLGHEFCEDGVWEGMEMFFTDTSDITAPKAGVCQSLFAWQITNKFSGGTV